MCLCEFVAIDNTFVGLAVGVTDVTRVRRRDHLNEFVNAAVNACASVPGRSDFVGMS